MTRAAANRYAQALFELSKDQNMLEQVRVELDTVKEVFAGNRELPETLEHPKVPKEQKENLLKNGFSGMSDMVQRTLLLMLEKNRIDSVVYMIEQFQHLVDEEWKVGHALVTTVKPLSDEERSMISETFAEKTGRNTLYIRNEIDSELIGGLKVDLGNLVFDGSIKGQLNRMERRLVSGK
ncbi:F0F1 ATP synthase subunit delta [Salibacterium halotolerans]|uniref:ATP synthase subunit delta n=1 Tax=Salibacterium halotolerans TaxID=1884432 RepID=A0A1I5X7Q5_9BACI|nr:F0F1 ATP synthase subunit delta [Salibacterium halotolerans]SFQ27687.1 F-type H+-transporting ATPase subunit delta [Salibacterium halotolerans]